MYPRIHLDHRSVLVTMECNQHDIGAIRHVVFEEDLTGKAVKYVISLSENHAVTDFCMIEDDHHTVTMVIPAQVTANAGSYDAQFIVLSQAEIDNSFEAWKAQVLAGTTPVMIETTETAVEGTSAEKPLSATLSFAFKILVFESVYANGSYFEGDLNKLIIKIEADNARIVQENTSLKARLTTLESKAATHDNRLDSAFDNLGELGTTVTQQGQTIADHSTSITAFNTQITNLSAVVGNNKLHCDQEVARLEEAIQGSDTGELSLWKQQVLAGATPVMIETTETASDTNESDLEAQTAAEEEGEAEDG